MNIRTRLALTCSALLLLFALGASARASLGDDAPVSTPVSVEAPAGDLEPVYECLPEAPAYEPAEAYECPKGIPYCQRDNQCDDFCGDGFGVCFQAAARARAEKQPVGSEATPRALESALSGVPASRRAKS